MNEMVCPNNCDSESKLLPLCTASTCCPHQRHSSPMVAEILTSMSCNLSLLVSSNVGGAPGVCNLAALALAYLRMGTLSHFGIVTRCNIIAFQTRMVGSPDIRFKPASINVAVDRTDSNGTTMLTLTVDAEEENIHDATTCYCLTSDC